MFVLNKKRESNQHNIFQCLNNSIILIKSKLEFTCKKHSFILLTWFCYILNTNFLRNNLKDDFICIS